MPEANVSAVTKQLQAAIAAQERVKQAARDAAKPKPAQEPAPQAPQAPQEPAR